MHMIMNRGKSLAVNICCCSNHQHIPLCIQSSPSGKGGVKVDHWRIESCSFRRLSIKLTPGTPVRDISQRVERNRAALSKYSRAA